MKMIKAIEVSSSAATDNEAAEIAMSLMMLDGCIGGRAYGVQPLYASWGAKFWRIQVFFRPGTMEGPERLVPESLAKECGMI